MLSVRFEITLWGTLARDYVRSRADTQACVEKKQHAGCTRAHSLQKCPLLSPSEMSSLEDMLATIVDPKRWTTQATCICYSFSPFSPRESRPDGPRQGSGNRVTDGDAPHRRTRSRTSAQTLALVRVHNYLCICIRISRSSTVAPRTRCPTHAPDRPGSPRSRPPPSGWCNPAP